MYFAPQIHSQKIFINSKDDLVIENDKSKKSKCTFFIPNVFTQNDTPILYEYIKTISLIEAKIPNSLYIINENNNKLNMIINGNPVSYIVPFGNYNANTFLSYWNTLLNGISITYDYINLKFIFTTTFPFSFLSTSTILKVLGFDSNTTYNSSSNTLTPPYQVNFTRSLEIFIDITPIDNKNTSSDGSTHFERIYLNNLVDGYYFYNNQSNYSIETQTFDTLNIEIVDEDGNYVNFNNKDWSMTLQIDIRGISQKITQPTINYFYGN